MHTAATRKQGQQRRETLTSQSDLLHSPQRTALGCSAHCEHITGSRRCSCQDNIHDKPPRETSMTSNAPHNETDTRGGRTRTGGHKQSHIQRRQPACTVIQSTHHKESAEQNCNRAEAPAANRPCVSPTGAAARCSRRRAACRRTPGTTAPPLRATTH